MISARLDIMLREVAMTVSLAHRRMETFTPHLASSNSRPQPRLRLVTAAENTGPMQLGKTATG
jgi:hypothetical protein